MLAKWLLLPSAELENIGQPKLHLDPLFILRG
jgi:hypothetical protein